MNAVGRLGSYISRSVYTVSTPFHPFGGAVDIIVVRQQDDSFKSSPWYVRFGKFQGVLKAKEKVVKICVNGVEMDFHMCLENDGQACFLTEVDVEDGEESPSSPPPWDGDDAEELADTRLSVKSKSCSFEGVDTVAATKIDLGNGNGVVRTKWQRTGFLGYVFGRKTSVKEGSLSENEKEDSGVKDNHLEHAEIAADLLEMKWTTNYEAPKCIKDNNASNLSSQDVSKGDSKNDNKSVSDKLDSLENALLDHKSVDSFPALENTETSAIEVSIGDKSSFHDQEPIESDVTSSNTPNHDTEAYSPPLYSHPINCSHEDGEVPGIFAIPSIINSTHEAQVEKSSTKDDRSSQLRRLESDRLCSFHSTVTSVSSEEGEDERLLFGDFDDLSANNEKNTSSVPSDNEEKEGDESHVPFADASKLTSVVSNVDIPVVCETQPDKLPRMAMSLPNLWAHDSHLSSGNGDQKLSEISRRAKVASITPKPNVKAAVPETDTKRTWPLALKRAKSSNPPRPSRNVIGNIGTKSLPRGIGGSVGEDLPKVNKKIVRALTPTSEQLASLNLKEGRNEIVFTFSTQMLGEQKVDAQIYLWKWDMRIVISDVDGTITRSDVLGQFMPLVGVDWSQTGVVHLFSAIKENGYQMLFLSARSISQAYVTRQFLVNLMQDGKGMPEGPVIISPDGLFPSLFREVVRRAPHEFKISCLEDIKALFPPDRNPFYAGFGNRDTDEISYLKVGIPKGKIFIINPKGEIIMNRHITNTKSYTSLQALVNGMFPDFTSSEQQEDFNSWNFWKLPPPPILR
ncbi:PREDICTED: phosphatidate phosphatase PAH2-like [Ipomoea nil]|uniref:phosphatidate phosphatase PAH2-like n=1 Tax=Ipomoea nil TaxID=35883 RepID=UPI000901144D|nr:PREDICTED: phosphatidate phosphatase PAH2-like [Ipomoea nil]